MKVKVLEEHTQYRMVLWQKGMMIFSWKKIASGTVADYKYALQRIVFFCKTIRPKVLFIDKREYDPKDLVFDRSWWFQHVLPVYEEVGILGMGHIIQSDDIMKNNTNAPFSFTMKIFNNFDEAKEWSKHLLLTCSNLK